MPRPKTACLDCGALCYSYRCKPCFHKHMNIRIERTKATHPTTSWWINVPRDQFSAEMEKQKPRWIEA